MAEKLVQNRHGASNAGQNIRPILRDFLDARQINQEFAQSTFDKAVRMMRLFAGHPPPEVQGTFSQVMLYFPWSIIDTELPISLQGLLTSKDWLTLKAKDYRFEPTKEHAQKWLRNELENVQEYSRTVIPTFQSAHIFGNGYRFYGHRFENKPRIEQKVNRIEMDMIDPDNPITMEEVNNFESMITGQYVNYFNVLPSPSGGMVNPSSQTAESGLDNLIVTMYPGEDFIKQQTQKGPFDKAEVDKLFEQKNTGDPENDQMYQYKDQLLGIEGQWNQFQMPEWVTKMRSRDNGLKKRFRVSWFFQRDKWAVIAEDKYVLYEGKPLFPLWPLANFVSSFNLDSFFGVSILEVVEDLIISMILNFNMRLDYVAGKFHPPKYIPKQLIDNIGGNKGDFDWTPYKIHTYNHTQYPGGIGNYIFSDVTPELTEQAFIEQGAMNGYLEDIIGQHGNENLNSNTATVGSSLISKDVARSMLRAVNLDMTGTHDSARLTLQLGAMFRNKDERIYTGAPGSPWEKIDHEAIAGEYGVEIQGARHLSQADEIFKRQLSVAPMFLNDPQVRGQLELKKQILNGAKFDNPDLILHGEQGSDPSLLLGEAGTKLPGGIPTSQNDARSVDNATVGPPEMSAAGVGAI